MTEVIQSLQQQKQNLSQQVLKLQREISIEASKVPTFRPFFLKFFCSIFYVILVVASIQSILLILLIQKTE